jgi:hypothetical protein
VKGVLGRSSSTVSRCRLLANSNSTTGPSVATKAYRPPSRMVQTAMLRLPVA